MGVLGNEPEVAGSFILFYVATKIGQSIFIYFFSFIYYDKMEIII